MSFPSQSYERAAARFIQTAVIVDDEAQIGGGTPSKPLKTPGRSSSTGTLAETTETSLPGIHSLDARALVNAFAEREVICGVIVPQKDDGAANGRVVSTAKQADIVVLDWRLNGDSGEEALSMLKNILKDDADERVRIIAVYTGEQGIVEIGKEIERHFNKSGRKFKRSNLGVVLSHHHSRIVIYAKSGTQLTSALTGRSISEKELPERLIADFAEMTKGLLPSIALTGLAAIRKNTHKILDKFQPELDPAFLAHRAGLPVPEDSQQHMVDQLASELHAVLEDATAKENPAGMAAVQAWLRKKAGPNRIFDFEQTKKLPLDKAIDLLKEGWDKQKPTDLSSKEISKLASIFAQEDDTENKLDKQLAWMFNFRTVFGSTDRILNFGTVLKRSPKDGREEYLICMRPKCECIRLKGEEFFPLLPLIEPKKGSVQLVLCTGNNAYRRLSVDTNLSNGSLVEFSPKRIQGQVVATRNGAGGFFFRSTDCVDYEWLGELKAEFAQRVAHHFAAGLSRVAVNNSEWLRRLEKI